MSTPSQLDALSKCYCFNDEQFRRVVAYLLDQIAAGGGGSSQDMQVAWTPTNVKLGEQVGFFTFSDAPGITSLTFSQATNNAGFDIEGTTALTSVSFPNLVSIDPGHTQNGYLSLASNTGLTSVSVPLLATVAGIVDIDGCTSLTSLSFPSLTSASSLNLQGNSSMTTLSIPVYVPANGSGINVSGDALGAVSVNAILAAGVANAGYVTGTINTSGGTNAAPSGQGIADKATLIGRGVNVTTN